MKKWNNWASRSLWTETYALFIIPGVAPVDYSSLSFFFVRRTKRRDTQMTTRVTEGAKRSRARAPLTKSEKKERLLAV